MDVCRQKAKYYGMKHFSKFTIEKKWKKKSFVQLKSKFF